MVHVATLLGATTIPAPIEFQSHCMEPHCPRIRQADRTHPKADAWQARARGVVSHVILDITTETMWDAQLAGALTVAYLTDLLMRLTLRQASLSTRIDCCYTGTFDRVVVGHTGDPKSGSPKCFFSLK
jgi:hypothetical protein